MARIFYKPFGLVFSVLGGIIAGAIFKRVWRAAAHEEEAPEATDKRRGWGEILAAAAAEGAIFAGVKALIDRAGATGFERATGSWPGET
jgi:predicted metal-dependent enzyme (double-stranded beta helix superfamily)